MTKAGQEDSMDHSPSSVASHSSRTVHSGHFMLSQLDDPEEESESCSPTDKVLAPSYELRALPDASQRSSRSLSCTSNSPGNVSPTHRVPVVSPEERWKFHAVGIDESLTTLLNCMTLAYSGKITNPKWNHFKGLKLTRKDKIRLNNIIWREYHMQYVKKITSRVVQFAAPLSESHAKPEAIIMEGKYWKRRNPAIAVEYQRWRRFYAEHRFPNSQLKSSSSVDEEPMDVSLDLLCEMRDGMDFAYNFDLFLDEQPLSFPDPRDIGHVVNADFVQPGLLQLQPSLEELSVELIQSILPLPEVPERSRGHSDPPPPSAAKPARVLPALLASSRQQLQDPRERPQQLEQVQEPRKRLVKPKVQLRQQLKQQPETFQQLQQHNPQLQTLPQQVTAPAPQFDQPHVQIVNPQQLRILQDQQSQLQQSQPMKELLLNPQQLQQLQDQTQLLLQAQEFRQLHPEIKQVQLVNPLQLQQAPEVKQVHVVTPQQLQHSPEVKPVQVIDAQQFQQSQEVKCVQIVNPQQLQQLQDQRQQPQEIKQLHMINTQQLQQQRPPELNQFQILTSHQLQQLQLAKPQLQRHPLNAQELQHRLQLVQQRQQIQQVSKESLQLAPKLEPSSDRRVCLSSGVDRASHSAAMDTSPGAAEGDSDCGRRHGHSELKRRSSINTGFDVLQSLIPALNTNPHSRVSKATLLHKAANLIRHLKQERNRAEMEMKILREEVDSLTGHISSFCAQLPDTGIAVSTQKANKGKEWFEAYVRAATLLNWKFYIYSLFIGDLFESYNNCVSLLSVEEFERTVMVWMEQHCSLVKLRPMVTTSLRRLSTTTAILHEPSALPQEALQIVQKSEPVPASQRLIRNPGRVHDSADDDSDDAMLPPPPPRTHR